MRRIFICLLVMSVLFVSGCTGSVKVPMAPQTSTTGPTTAPVQANTTIPSAISANNTTLMANATQNSNQTSGGVSGRITTQTGDAIGNCTVRIVDVWQVKKPNVNWYTTVYYETTADGNGYYQFNNVSAGTYEVYAEKTSAIGGFSDSFTVNESEMVTINVKIYVSPQPTATPATPTPVAFGSVSGRITTQYGDPVGGCDVKIVDVWQVKQPRVGWYTTVYYETTADNNGYYHFDSVAVGTYEIFAEKTSAMSRMTGSFNVNSGVTTTVDVQILVNPTPTPTPTVTPTTTPITNGSP